MTDPVNKEQCQWAAEIYNDYLGEVESRCGYEAILPRYQRLIEETLMQGYGAAFCMRFNALRCFATLPKEVMRFDVNVRKKIAAYACLFSQQVGSDCAVDDALDQAVTRGGNEAWYRRYPHTFSQDCSLNLSVCDYLLYRYHHNHPRYLDMFTCDVLVRFVPVLG